MVAKVYLSDCLCSDLLHDGVTLTRVLEILAIGFDGDFPISHGLVCKRLGDCLRF